MLISTPVGPLGSGMGGGIELTVANLAKVLVQFGHQVTVVTPSGASLEALSLRSEDVELVQIPGELQPTAQTQQRSAPVVTSEVLSNMWEYARREQSQYDLLVNFAYDWLPFCLTSMLTTPIAHFVSMASLSDRLDQSIAAVAVRYPQTLGAYTQAQADTFEPLVPSAQWQILGCGLDLVKYGYCDRPSEPLAWVGRISPEKGLEDAINAAITANQPLQIFGKVEDATYWKRLQPLIAQANSHRESFVEYCGFLPTELLQKMLGRTRALLVTPYWVEAFGIVVVEALACGVPVIAYDRGGPAEIVQDGKTGWLVEPGNVDGLVSAIAKIDQIDRAACRQQAEANHSLEAWGRQFEQWFYKAMVL